MCSVCPSFYASACPSPSLSSSCVSMCLCGRAFVSRSTIIHSPPSVFFFAMFVFVFCPSSYWMVEYVCAPMSTCDTEHNLRWLMCGLVERGQPAGRPTLSRVPRESRSYITNGLHTGHMIPHLAAQAQWLYVIALFLWFIVLALIEFCLFNTLTFFD